MCLAPITNDPIECGGGQTFSLLAVIGDIGSKVGASIETGLVNRMATRCAASAGGIRDPTRRSACLKF